MLHALVLAALLGTPATAAVAPAAQAAPGAEWQQDPVRWVLTNPELRQWRGLAGEEEAEAFREEIWRRRDPDPGRLGNRRRETFYRRVAEADALFSDEALPGSQTERGRAYLLLGPPSQILQSRRRGPKFSPATTLGKAQEAPMVLTEQWLWRPEDLSEELRKELTARRWRPHLEVRFQQTRRGYSLEDGEDLLRAALRSLLRSSAAEP
jgi:GWxTD domain-containing protein